MQTCGIRQVVNSSLNRDSNRFQNVRGQIFKLIQVEEHGVQLAGTGRVNINDFLNDFCTQWHGSRQFQPNSALIVWYIPRQFGGYKATISITSSTKASILRPQEETIWFLHWCYLRVPNSNQDLEIVLICTKRFVQSPDVICKQERVVRSILIYLQHGYWFKYFLLIV